MGFNFGNILVPCRNQGSAQRVGSYIFSRIRPRLKPWSSARNYESPRAHARGIFFCSLCPEPNIVQGFARNFSLYPLRRRIGIVLRSQNKNSVQIKKCPDAKFHFCVSLQISLRQHLKCLLSVLSVKTEISNPGKDKLIHSFFTA